MPQFYLDIPNVEETITAPLINSIVPRILNSIKIFEGQGYDLRFGNWSETFVNKGSEIDLKSQTRSENRLPTDVIVKIEADERYNEEMSRGVHIREGIEKNVFVCNKTRTNMHVGYQPMVIDMSINIGFTNRHQAESFRRKLRLMSTKSVDGISVKAKYTFAIPYKFVFILNRIHTLMENQHGYGVGFGEWLREGFTANLTTLANQSGGRSVLSINEVAQNVLILFESPDDTPLKDKDNEAGRWNIGLSYKIYYDRPDIMRLRFQNLIHNQLMDVPLLSKFTLKTDDESLARANVNMYGAIRVGALPIIANKLSGGSSPVWDDWLQSIDIKDYSNMLRVLVSVDESDPHALLDLNDVTDWEFTPNMLNWLRDTYDTLSKKYENIFFINYWVFDKIKSSEKLSTDSNLVIRSTEVLNPRENHHVTIGLCTDPTLLHDEVWKKLGEHPGLLREYLNVIAPDLIDIIEGWVKIFRETYNSGEDGGWHNYNWTGSFDWDNDTLPPWVVEKIKEIFKIDYDTHGNNRRVRKTVLLHGVCVFKNRGKLNG